MAPVQVKGLRALQIWCSQVTADYANVHITDLTTSFRDGLAFNAIIHHFRPDLFDYKSLNPKNVRENNAHAFRLAEEELNIPALLDPEDMVDCQEPDKLSVATYLQQLYHLFKSASPRPRTPPSRTSLTRLSSSEGENDSLLSTSSSESPPSFRIAPERPNFNRNDLIAKYGEDIFSCSSSPPRDGVAAAANNTSSSSFQNRQSSPIQVRSKTPSSSTPATTTVLSSTPKGGHASAARAALASPPARSVATTTQKKNTAAESSSAVASMRKQFEQFTKISAS